MRSEYDNLMPTPAQQLVDVQFLDEMEKSFVAPLVEELKSQVLGYEEMGWRERMFSVLKLNEPLFGLGDFLEVQGMLIYSGTFLGDDRRMVCGDSSVEQYHPRFIDMGSSILRNNPDGSETISDIEYFFRYERDLYDGQHVSYKMALLYTYIKSKVFALPGETLRFVLGCRLGSGEKLETLRVTVRPLFGNTNAYSGWEIMIRDAKPSAKLMVELGKWIRNEATESEALINALGKDLLETSSEDKSKNEAPFSRVDYSSITFEGAELSKKPRRQRRPDRKTELACMYIYRLEQEGVIIDGRKKGGIGFAEIAAKLKVKFGDEVRDYSNPDYLRRTYYNWKKRYESS